MHHPTDRIPHTTAFITPVVEHWLEQEINLIRPPGWVDPTSYRAMSGRSTTELYPTPHIDFEISDCGHFMLKFARSVPY